jgi:hypothetical protein
MSSNIIIAIPKFFGKSVNKIAYRHIMFLAASSKGRLFHPLCLEIDRWKVRPCGRRKLDKHTLSSLSETFVEGTT